MNDPVPKLPLLTMGYVHVSPEYYVKTPNERDVAAGDVAVISGAVNLFKGNQAQLWPDVEAHRWYFGRAYDCNAKVGKRGLRIRGVEEDVEVFATF